MKTLVLIIGATLAFAIASFAETHKTATATATRTPEVKRSATKTPDARSHENRHRRHNDWDNERPRHYRFPIPGIGLFGLPLGDVVSEGSRGTDDGFKEEHQAPPIRYSSTADNVVRPEAPPIEPPAPPPTVIDAWEIVSLDGVITGNNGSVCHYDWKLRIKNNVDYDMIFAATISFVDRDGRSLDSSEVVGLRVPANTEQEFSGSKMMMVDLALTVVKPVAQLNER